MDDLQTPGQVPAQPPTPSSMPPSAFSNDGHFRVILLASLILILVVSVVFLLPASPAGGPGRGSLPGTSQSSQEQKVSLVCPVVSGCQQAVAVTYQENPALAMKVLEGVKITSAAPVVDSITFVEPPYIEGKSPRGLYQSFIEGDSCYTLTYTFSADTDITKIDLLPLEGGHRLATASASLIEDKGEQAYNLFLQLQKRLLEGSESDPDFQRCRITNLTPAEFGQYLPLDATSFE